MPLSVIIHVKFNPWLEQMISVDEQVQVSKGVNVIWDIETSRQAIGRYWFRIYFNNDISPFPWTKRDSFYRQEGNRLLLNENLLIQGGAANVPGEYKYGIEVHNIGGNPERDLPLYDEDPYLTVIENNDAFSNRSHF